jgi:putative ribosome biogenesis GTPase RsgA
MEYVDCVVMGNKGIGKHSLIGNFQAEDKGRKDEVSLSLTIEKKRVDFIVKIADGE